MSIHVNIVIKSYLVISSLTALRNSSNNSNDYDADHKEIYDKRDGAEIVVELAGVFILEAVAVGTIAAVIVSRDVSRRGVGVTILAVSWITVITKRHNNKNYDDRYTEA